MTKIDVVSGFLGAGKTTLIKKLLSEALNGTNTVLIENANELEINSIKEFKKIGIMAGASTPQKSIYSVIEKIKSIE